MNLKSTTGAITKELSVHTHLKSIRLLSFRLVLFAMGIDQMKQ